MSPEAVATLNPQQLREKQMKERIKNLVHVPVLTNYQPYVTACKKAVVAGMQTTGNPPDLKVLEAEALTLCPECRKALGL